MHDRNAGSPLEISKPATVRSRGSIRSRSSSSGMRLQTPGSQIVYWNRGQLRSSSGTASTRSSSYSQVLDEIKKNNEQMSDLRDMMHQLASRNELLHLQNEALRRSVPCLPRAGTAGGGPAIPALKSVSSSDRFQTSTGLMNEIHFALRGQVAGHSNDTHRQRGLFTDFACEQKRFSALAGKPGKTP
mmetsp:Transcript_34548/g.90117  ORF Transcript_34548/g.90117 Transcript_34548/m.90117 type:complete len:187 (+) Transcript_34548:16-576(+)